MFEEDAADHRWEKLTKRQRPIRNGQARTGAGDEGSRAKETESGETDETNKKVQKTVAKLSTGRTFEM